MLGKLVSVHLFRLERALRLRRVPPGALASRYDAPAILVIPREGSLRAPHFMILSCVQHRRDLPPGPQIFDGAHTVAGIDDLADRQWREVADVLVGARRAWNVPKREVARLLDRYPGCEIATVGRGHDCLAGLRDGRLATITTAGGSSGGGSWPAVYGSFLYGWRVAGMPFECLATASVIVGRYTGSSAGRLGSLEVAGRAQIRLARRRMWNAGGMSA
ncbi:hypothetical protein OG884_13815 [Streptosporangium sp. NBC_01755]|uniref:hypothetical protein n=1 Tax=unclassified Streptosporangium TaxID=2632669 RepID=UPI002DDABD6E|nr:MULTISPECIES: hypothetical protein [unclassified Streptosporangium]WSA25687.1 hypothetical protein OIE13_33050 [Streptosporangium sp. NBC_01810]WSD02923.1 hypothetical protein OG884_13815 [Streptosporangium sp. NBC_01755]